MNEQRFPAGWDEERVKRLLAELDARTEEEWLAADEAAAADGGDQAVITVPAALLPEIRRLLASHKTAYSPNQALHPTATVHGVDYLLTWNCKHIANADALPKVYRLLTDMGYLPPLIVTPEEFSGNV